MKQKTDRHLQTPQEANRDKHINFKAIENGEEDPATEEADENISQALHKQRMSEGKKPKKPGDKTFKDDQAH